MNKKQYTSACLSLFLYLLDDSLYAYVDKGRKWPSRLCSSKEDICRLYFQIPQILQVFTFSSLVGGKSYNFFTLPLYRISKFQKSEAFIGFLKDTPASVVFQATNLLRLACTAAKDGGIPQKGKWADIFNWSQLNPGDHCTEECGQHWRDAVSCFLYHGPIEA